MRREEIRVARQSLWIALRTATILGVNWPPSPVAICYFCSILDSRRRSPSPRPPRRSNAGAGGRARGRRHSAHGACAWWQLFSGACGFDPRSVDTPPGSQPKRSRGTFHLTVQRRGEHEGRVAAGDSAATAMAMATAQ